MHTIVNHVNSSDLPTPFTLKTTAGGQLAFADIITQGYEPSSAVARWHKQRIMPANDPIRKIIHIKMTKQLNKASKKETVVMDDSDEEDIDEEMDAQDEPKEKRRKIAGKGLKKAVDTKITDDTEMHYDTEGENTAVEEEQISVDKDKKQEQKMPEKREIESQHSETDDQLSQTQANQASSSQETRISKTKSPQKSQKRKYNKK